MCEPGQNATAGREAESSFSPRLTLLYNAEVYAPEKLGTASVLFCGEHILQLGAIDRRRMLDSGIEVEAVDLRGSLLIPGLVDSHAHLLGGSGENGGFSSQTPEISFTELIRGGITTVVGTLGADTTMKTMEGLLAKVKGLNDEGISAYCYTGGYPVPPTTIMSSVSNDILFIQEVIGTGELAISDARSSAPRVSEIARIVSDTYMAGMLARKAGITHFHVGGSKGCLQLLWTLLDRFPEIRAELLYPTHINRHEALVKDAVRLTREGAFIDMDVVDEDLAPWLKVYKGFGGELKNLTVSSDAGKSSPSNLLHQLRDCVLNHGYRLEDLLPVSTSNAARVLKMPSKGKIKTGAEASFLVLEKGSLELQSVISKGRFLLRDGSLCVRERFLKGSNRMIELRGETAV